MVQLLGISQMRNLITDEEAHDFVKKVSKDRQASILAQATVESVTAFQLAQRRAKKERNEKEKAAAEIGSKAGSVEAGSVGETLESPYKVEQIIYL